MTGDTSSATDGIRYALCESADVPEVVRLLARTFAANDPPAVAVGLTPDELEAYLARAARGAGSDGLTFVARDLESGQLAGALLALDAATPPPSVDGLSPKFTPVMEIFGQLDAEIPDASPPAPGRIVNLLMLGVADGFARRGIAQELVRTCLANGLRAGYRQATTTATNPVSQHIFRKLGFATRAGVSYGDYRRDGVAVFASIADAGGPMTMTRDLRP